MTEGDEAVQRLARIEATLRAQTADPTSPAARFDPDDLRLLLVAIRCTVAGVSTIEQAMGLVGKWRNQARRQALQVAVHAVPTTTQGEPWPRAVEVHRHIVRHPRDPISVAVLNANDSRRPSRSALYRIFTISPGSENSPVRINQS